MDHKPVLKKARFNSILLALQFSITTVTMSSSAPGFITVIGGVATLFTIYDVIRLNQVLKDLDSQPADEAKGE